MVEVDDDIVEGEDVPMRSMSMNPRLSFFMPCSRGGPAAGGKRKLGPVMSQAVVLPRRSDPTLEGSDVVGGVARI